MDGVTRNDGRNFLNKVIHEKRAIYIRVIL